MADPLAPEPYPPGTEVFYLRLWHCGDEICDCWQPQIERRIVNSWVGARLMDVPWTGTFFTEGGDSDDWTLARQEGRRAARYLYRMREKYGAVVDIDNWWADRRAGREEG